eukprot:124003-Chlamydomonas_euryale.AAC.10
MGDEKYSQRHAMPIKAYLLRWCSMRLGGSPPILVPASPIDAWCVTNVPEMLKVKSRSALHLRRIPGRRSARFAAERRHAGTCGLDGPDYRLRKNVNSHNLNQSTLNWEMHPKLMHVAQAAALRSFSRSYYNGPVDQEQPDCPLRPRGPPGRCAPVGARGRGDPPGVVPWCVPCLRACALAHRRHASRILRLIEHRLS